jgi:hypothetical protein
LVRRSPSSSSAVTSHGGDNPAADGTWHKGAGENRMGELGFLGEMAGVPRFLFGRGVTRRFTGCEPTRTRGEGRGPVFSRRPNEQLWIVKVINCFDEYSEAYLMNFLYSFDEFHLDFDFYSNWTNEIFVWRLKCDRMLLNSMFWWILFMFSTAKV